MDIGRLFFRVIEQDDGTWACRHGFRGLDRHDTQDAAVVHITELADKQRPIRIYLHHLDGRVSLVSTLD